jgi:hypothetical protein
MDRDDQHRTDPPSPRPPRRRHRARRALLIALGVVALLVVVGRIVLDPIARHYTEVALARNPKVQGSFSDVHVTLLPPSYQIRKLKLVEPDSGRWDEPLFYAENTRVSILWRELLRRHLVGQVRLENPKILAVRRHEEKAKKGAEAGSSLADMAPIKLDRLEIVDGEVLIGVGKGRRAPQLWINQLALVAENMATRKALMEGEPSRLSLTGRVQKSGKLAVEASMDPWAKALTFTAKGSLQDLQARELYSFLANQTDLQADKGEIDLFLEVKARNGELDGGVKPILKNLEIKAEGKGLGDRIKAALADASIEFLSDDIPGRDAVATTIPIKGRVDVPSAQMLPTVLGVVRNAFVAGLRAGFTNLPPAEADKKENPIKQAWRALTDDDEPPRAQPEGKADGGKPAPEGKGNVQGQRGRRGRPEK